MTGADETTALPREALRPPLLLTPRQVGEILAVSPRTLRRYAARGLLAPVRLGRTLRYREADVLNLVADDRA